jgi:hypothetical protein
MISKLTCSLFLGQTVSSDPDDPERVLSLVCTLFVANETSGHLCKVSHSTLPKFVVIINSLSLSINEQKYRYS